MLTVTRAIQPFQRDCSQLLCFSVLHVLPLPPSSDAKFICDSHMLVTRREGFIVSQSQSHFTTGGLPPISSSWPQAPWDSRRAFFFQLNTCFHSPYVTFSLTRGWVCSIQLLLAFASTLILRSDSRGTRDIFYSLKFETPPTWRARFPYLYPPGTGWSSYTPRHWFPSRRLLRLAGLRWRYSTPPPHGKRFDCTSRSCSLHSLRTERT
jgi:hypothetical protein